MGTFGRIFGRGKQIESLLKKAEEAFGHKDWTAAASLARELRSKVDPRELSRFATEVLRAYYLEASSLHKQGKIEEALSVIDEALDLPVSGLAEIGRLLSEISDETKDTEIIPLLEKALQKLPDNNYVTLALIGKYVAAGRFDEAVLPLYSRMHQRAPENNTVLFGLAMTLRKLERFDRTTLAIYRKAFHEFSTNNDFLYALARTYSAQNPPVNEALPVIERALKFFPDEKQFQEARTAILANLPSLTPEQVRILVDAYKRTRDRALAFKLADHLLASHAEDEDACRVYEAVWRDHPKRITILSILAERYRLAGRKDPEAMEVLQAFFDDMPRERENTLYLARRYAEKAVTDERAVLVYQQALREGAVADVDNVVMALATAYLQSRRSDEEAARIYRMAHAIEPENFSILTALKDVALSGGRLEGARANALIDYITNPEAPREEVLKLAARLGPSLAAEGRTDADACGVYRINFQAGVATEQEEDLLVTGLIERDEIKLSDILLVEKVAKRNQSEQLGRALAELYRQSGEITEDRLALVVQILSRNPGDRSLAIWVLPHLLNKHGEDPKYFPLLGEMIARGYLPHCRGIKPGVVARTATRIGRDLIREGKFKEATGILSEAYKVDANPILQYLLGVAYQGMGDLQTGIAIFKALQKADRENPVYRYRLAVLTMMSGDLDAAEKELDTLAVRYPGHPLIHLRKGMIKEAREDRAGAIEEYEKVASHDKGITAFVEYRMGILKSAEGDYNKALSLLEKAAQSGAKSPALETARLVTRVILCDRALLTGSLDEAESLLKPFTGEKRPPWPVVSTERFLRLALRRLQAGAEKEAQSALEASEKTGTHDTRVSCLLALIDMNASRPKAAIERLERALGGRDNVGAELAHRLWTVISIRLGKHDEAREAADWLLAREAPGAEKLRFLAFWRNPLEIDWPSSLHDWTYEDLEKLGFPVSLIGRLAYKRADYEGGAKYLERYYKDQSKPDRVEAEFLLGLMYIKQKKANLGLHYWGHILAEGHRELSGRQRAEALMLLGYHFLEHGQPEKSREAFALAKEAGAEDEEINEAIAFSYLQAGYLAAKADNMTAAIREWEKILELHPDNWQAVQNLALAHFWVGNDDLALSFFDRLFTIAEKHPENVEPETLSFLLEETRKMINQLISLKQMEPSKAQVKREMLLDEIQEANRYYWTLGVKKGATSEEAQANYFRLVKIYNPEKYPEDFMVLEKAYTFFNKPGLLRKNEQKVFNAFHFRLLRGQQSEGLIDIPPSPQVVEYIRQELDPRNHVDLEALLADSNKRKDFLPALNLAPDFACPDYLAGW